MTRMRIVWRVYEGLPRRRRLYDVLVRSSTTSRKSRGLTYVSLISYAGAI